MKQIIWISLIVIVLILGLVIGYSFNSSSTQTQKNLKSFNINIDNNAVYVSTSDCSQEYENKYGYKFGDCEIDSVHVGERFIDRVDCSCWQES